MAPTRYGHAIWELVDAEGQPALGIMHEVESVLAGNLEAFCDSVAAGADLQSSGHSTSRKS